MFRSFLFSHHSHCKLALSSPVHEEDSVRIADRRIAGDLNLWGQNKQPQNNYPAEVWTLWSGNLSPFFSAKGVVKLALRFGEIF